MIKSVLDNGRFGWLMESAAVNDLWRGTIREFGTVVRNFVPDLATESTPDAETRARWQRLQEAGINTAPSGAEKYISLRTEWDAYITSLAPTFNYDLDEIDTALAKVK